MESLHRWILRPLCRKPLVIASRESRLAMWQAEHVQSRLQAQNPDREVQILGMTTRGDQILDRPASRDWRQGAVHQGTGSCHG